MEVSRVKKPCFTMKLEPELRGAFMAEAKATHHPASQVVRDLMRDFVQRQREAREYDAFLGVARDLMVNTAPMRRRSPVDCIRGRTQNFARVDAASGARRRRDGSDL
ncbi:hypothetical protein SAMN04487768_1484 [Burkholderia sp. b13]|nr:hypothetical protein SAMN04487768_1484 [Burkholderia sp. b13]